MVDVLRIGIAGICCELALRNGDASFRAQLLSRYEGFLTEEEPDLRIEAEAVRGLNREARPSTNGERTVSIFEEGGRYRMVRTDNPFRAEVDTEAGEGRLIAERSVYCFDSFLRILYSVLLARAEGGLFHGLGLNQAGSGRLLLGKSGSGKTTLGRLAGARDGTVLSDELVAVRSLEGSLTIYATPFWGEFAAGKNSADVPLTDVYLLRQDPRNFLRPVKSSSAVREILSCTLFFGPPSLTGSVLGLCFRLAASVSALHFRPTDEVFALIRKGESCVAEVSA